MTYGNTTSTKRKKYKNILDKYDINDLLIRAIPKNYHIANSAYLEIYKIKTKFDTPVTYYHTY